MNIKEFKKAFESGVGADRIIILHNGAIYYATDYNFFKSKIDKVKVIVNLYCYEEEIGSCDLKNIKDVF
jgi:hypothetical protein